MLEQYDLNPDTIFIIGGFSILWCQFEQRYFDSEAKTRKLFEWANRQTINDIIIDLCSCVRNEANEYLGKMDMDSIRQRIYSETNQGSQEHRAQIHSFLENDDSETHFIGCMLFIQRIRHNLFHGLKGIYTLNSQKKMFDSINKLLDYILQCQD